jgi:DNA-binding FadR family transcriptional regulator
LRCSLEIQSSKLAAERATDEALESLIQMVSADEEPDNELELLRQDEAFHIKIAELTGNPELVNMLRGVNNRIHFARWIDRRARRNSREEHIAIARAIASRDPDEAGRLMDSHIRRRYQQIVEIIKIGYGEIFAGANEISSVSAHDTKTAAE